MNQPEKAYNQQQLQSSFKLLRMHEEINRRSIRRPSSSGFFSVWRWLRRDEKQINCSNDAEESTPPSPLFSSCESVDSVFSTSTSTSFAFVSPAVYGPIAQLQEPYIDSDTERYRHRLWQRRRHCELNHNVLVTEKYRLSTSNSLRSDIQMHISEPRGKKCKSINRISRHSDRELFNNLSLPNTQKSILVKKDYEKSITFLRRTLSDSSRDVTCGAYVHVKGKRRAPQPPRKYGSVEPSTSLPLNDNKLGKSVTLTNGRKKRPAPPPPNLIKSGMDNVKSNDELFTNDTLMLEKGILKPVRKTTVPENKVQENDVKEIPPVSPKPWYKRVANYKDHRKFHNLGRNKDKTFSESDNYKNYSINDLNPRFSFFTKFGEKSEDKRKSGISLLANISELDRQAAEIINKMHIQENLENDDDRYYEVPNSFRTEDVENGVKNKNLPEPNSTKKLISKFDAIANRSDIKVETNVRNANDAIGSSLKGSKKIFNEKHIPQIEVQHSPPVTPAMKHTITSSPKMYKLDSAIPKSPKDELNTHIYKTYYNVEKDIPETNILDTERKALECSQECLQNNSGIQIATKKCEEHSNLQQTSTDSKRLNELKQEIPKPIPRKSLNRSDTAIKMLEETDSKSIHETDPSKYKKNQGTCEEEHNKNNNAPNYKMFNILNMEHTDKNNSSLSKNTENLKETHLRTKEQQRLFEQLREMKNSLKRTPEIETSLPVHSEKDEVGKTKPLDISANTVEDPDNFDEKDKVKKLDYIKKSIMIVTDNEENTFQNDSIKYMKGADTPHDTKNYIDNNNKLGAIKKNLLLNYNRKKDNGINYLQSNNEDVTNLTHMVYNINNNENKNKISKVSSSCQTNGFSKQPMSYVVPVSTKYAHSTLKSELWNITDELAETRTPDKTNELICLHNLTNIKYAKPYPKQEEVDPDCMNFPKNYSSESYANERGNNNIPKSDDSKKVLNVLTKEFNTPCSSDFDITWNHSDLNNANNNELVNKLLRNLEKSISDGNQLEASRLAKDLANMKVNCSVRRNKSTNGKDGTQSYTDKITKLELYIEDKITHQGPISMNVPLSMTVNQLKEKIAEDLEIPILVQRLVIGNQILVVSDETKTLEEKGIDHNVTSIFVYIVEPGEHKLPPNSGELILNGIGPSRYISKISCDHITLISDLNNPLNIKKSGSDLSRNSIKENVTDNNRNKKEEKWICTTCTLNNSHDYKKCSICYSPRPPEVSYVTKNVQTTAEHYMQLLDLDKEDIVSNKEPFNCSVCLEDFNAGEGIILRECLHIFCRECLVSVIKYNEEAEVKCPFRDERYSCDCILQEREIKALAGLEIYEQHLAKSIAQAENKMGNTFHCKTLNCLGWCIFEDNVNTFLCPVCSKANCLTCQAIHTDMDCRQYQEQIKQDSDINTDTRRTKEMLKELVEKGEAMTCPTCQIVLMKKWGCDWLRCSMCKTEICWVTRGPRWGLNGKGDITGGCKCGVDGKKCHVKCNYCH